MERKMHPRNKYAEKPPDFKLLAELYPTFKEYVTYGAHQKARIDWTDFNATRELTRSLLHHDYGITWWIPDGQLCPTITNRANYIHWIEDLLASAPAPWQKSGGHQVAGIDIGTGANCIYPLLGAALLGWRFVGTDITPVALEWAKKNVEANPHLASLLEVRSALVDGGTRVDCNDTNYSDYGSIGPALPPAVQRLSNEEVHDLQSSSDGLVSVYPDNGPQGPPKVFSPETKSRCESSSDEVLIDRIPSKPCEEPDCSQPPTSTDGNASMDTEEGSSSVLLGVVREEERFDFCMCNPPFFASMAEACLNPRTACGGSAAEMVCPGGEEAFVAHIIEDSVKLKHAIHWYTTMVGRKVTLKGMTAKLWALGATMVRTTEFIQGRTTRWGLAWSFTPGTKAVQRRACVSNQSTYSFMLEGLARGSTAVAVLQVLYSQLQSFGALCTVSLLDFSVTGILPEKLSGCKVSDDVLGKRKRDAADDMCPQAVSKDKSGPSFMALVLQQAPGSLLIKASLSKGGNHGPTFIDLFERVEQSLKHQFVLRSQ